MNENRHISTHMLMIQLPKIKCNRLLVFTKKWPSLGCIVFTLNDEQDWLLFFLSSFLNPRSKREKKLVLVSDLCTSISWIEFLSVSVALGNSLDHFLLLNNINLNEIHEHLYRLHQLMQYLTLWMVFMRRIESSWLLVVLASLKLYWPHKRTDCLENELKFKFVAHLMKQGSKRSVHQWRRHFHYLNECRNLVRICKAISNDQMIEWIMFTLFFWFNSILIVIIFFCVYGQK